MFKVTANNLAASLLVALLFVAAPVVSVTGAPPKISGAEYFYGQDGHGNKAMCVIQQPHSDGDGVSFSAWNGMQIPITISFKPELQNLKADKSFPLILVVAPGSTQTAYSAKAVDRRQRHSWANNWTWGLGISNARHDDSFLYALPFPRERKFPITQGYNGSWSHKDTFAFSIDWDMPIGTPVLAARQGIVAFVRDGFTGHSTDPAWKERTNTIIIFHDDGTLAEYSHIQQRSARFKAGARVKKGDLIALSADVGYSQSPHLHFRVFRRIDGPRGEGEESLPVMFEGNDGKPVSLGR